MKKSVLFVCSHNSTRSQIAELYLNKLYGDRYDAYSAGIQPGEVNPFLFEAMIEEGIDISESWAKDLAYYDGFVFDLIVVVCDEDADLSLFDSGTEVWNHSFKDPSSFTGSDDVIFNKITKVRDEIKKWIIIQFARARL